MEGSDPSNIPESEETKSCNDLLFEELFDRLSAAEQRLAVAEQQRNEQFHRCYHHYQAEEDLGAQIQKANKFEDMYYTEWRLRTSAEAELDKAKKRIEELEKLVVDRAESSKRDEQN